MIAWAWWRRAELEHATLLVLAALLFFSAAVQPWYATWLVPAAALALQRETRPRSARPGRARPLALASFAFAATVALAYLVYTRAPGTPFAPPAWAVVVEYAVAAAVFLGAQLTSLDRKAYSRRT